MKAIAVIIMTIGGLAFAGTAQANHDPSDCQTVDYQGAPLEMCPVEEPDPTNCYTGWYQGAPIEVCMPTGHTLPPGTVDMRTGQPPVIHNSVSYVPPTTVAPEPVARSAPKPVTIQERVAAGLLDMLG